MQNLTFGDMHGSFLCNAKFYLFTSTLIQLKLLKLQKKNPANEDELIDLYCSVELGRSWPIMEGNGSNAVNESVNQNSDAINNSNNSDVKKYVNIIHGSNAVNESMNQN